MEGAQLKRKLTAVLLADVVGYSRLMSVDEDSTHVALAEYVTGLIEPKIAENRGKLIRSMGDGFLVSFDSAIDAVRCGLDIQRQLADHNVSVNPDRRIQLRIGINTGDVIVDDRDIYGHSVNIAARLEGLAEPGEIYVTRTVRDQLQGHPSLLFEDMGERRVKNIKRAIRVYRVRCIQAQQRRALAREVIAAGRRLFGFLFLVHRHSSILVITALAVVAAGTIAGVPLRRDYSLLSNRASIMVLPLRNASNNPEEDYFADAVTEDLTIDLSRLSDTLVISAATAFTYKGKPIDPKEVGRECGVRYLLQGSIRRIGTTVQTNAQLVDASSAANIWADRFDNEFTGLAELEGAITGRIASSLRIQLVKAESLRAIALRPTNPDAFDLRLHAMALLASPITQKHHLVARRYLEDSLQLDPRSAEGWSQLAHLLINDYLNNWLQRDENPHDLRQRAEDAVRKALDIDPSIAMAHQADGLVHRAKGEHQQALDAFDRAIYLDRNFSRAYAQKANQLVMVGRAQEAPPLVLKAIALSPRDPILGVFYWIIGRAYFVMANYNDAIIWLRKSVELTPDYWYSEAYLLAAYALTMRLQEHEAASTLSDYKRRFSRYTVQYISQLYAYEIPQPNLQASIQELYRGLHLAGVP
jgi:adenylate cyclase